MRWQLGGMGTRLAVVLLALLFLPAMVPGEAAAEDVEVSTTFLTFFKNGGGYMEYRVTGRAAADLRGLIDDPGTMFPFETRVSDGDGTVDQAEGESYMRNLDDILTRRQIVLRGVKMENVDVDEHRGLIGSDVNDTREIYLHITFRGGIQYDTMEFNVSGLEPLAVLYGSYDAIPDTLTVDERMFIVSAGMGAYSKEAKEEGTLWNLRVPLAVVVSYHGSYSTSSPPSVRMEYDHDTLVGNPLVLMLLMFLITILTLKLPKALARENDKERVRELHLGILVCLLLFWTFYVLGGNAVLVWSLGVALVVSSYALSHRIYARDWHGLAEDSEGLDLGEAITAVDPVNGYRPPADPVAQGPSLLGVGGRGVDANPSDDVVVALPGQEGVLETWEEPSPHPAPAGAVPVYRTVANPSPQASQGTTAAGPVAAPAPPGPPDSPQAATKSMRCRCGGVFKVPLQPRPLVVQCPHCGTSGTLRA